MIKDITLGQYYPAESVVHKLDPRVKLFATFLFIIALFSFRGLFGFALVTAMLVFMIRVSHVPLVLW
jgi:energy-coupling factor transport system permease protein